MRRERGEILSVQIFHLIGRLILVGVGIYFYTISIFVSKIVILTPEVCNSNAYNGDYFILSLSIDMPYSNLLFSYFENKFSDLFLVFLFAHDIVDII